MNFSDRKRKIKAQDYLPQNIASAAYRSKIYNSVADDAITYEKAGGNKINFTKRFHLGDSRVIHVGYMQYNEKLVSLEETTTFVSLFSGPYTTGVYLLSADPGGQFVDENMHYSVAIDEKLHEVTTPAGHFKDCVLATVSQQFGEKAFRTHNYYAKGLGLIKEVSEISNGLTISREITRYQER